jgi:hypothetical protein
MWGRVGAVAVFLGLSALGCADSPSRSIEIWCQGLCAAQRRCGDTRTPISCQGDCVSQRPGLADISEPGAVAERPCLANLSCQAAVLGDELAWQAELDVCWQQAKVSVSVSPYIRSFCAAYSQAWFECGFWFPTDTCEHQFAMWADHVVDRVALCVAQSTCPALDTCVATVFDNL